jgi:hypothetical protein
LENLKTWRFEPASGLPLNVTVSTAVSAWAHVCRTTSIRLAADGAPESAVWAKTAATKTKPTKAGRDVTIAFEAVRVGGVGRPEHLSAFEQHLRKVVPGIVRGVA